MKKNLLSFIIVIIFIIGISFLIYSNGTKNPSDKGDIGGYSNIKYVKLAGQNIKVDLATTIAQQEQGLSGLAGLNENEGMLFVFAEPGKYPFWMKDMNFPIDMIWISEDLKVVYIKKNALPESYPETFGPDTSSENAKYVLEVVSGFADKNNLQAGDMVEFINN